MGPDLGRHGTVRANVNQVPVASFDLARFRDLLGDDYRVVEKAILRARRLLAGRAVWHVNSTPRGGGVAELLRSLLAYARGAGIDSRWMAIRPDDPAFFDVTKRIHNNLHGFPGDGGPLGERERGIYETGLEGAAAELATATRDGDVAVLHDPQTAGLCAAVSGTGAATVWRCHIGADRPNDLARRAVEFLRPYVEEADGWIFSRRDHVWPGLDESRTWIVHPSIDAFSPKNQELSEGAARAIVHRIGLADGGSGARPTFTREDGSPGRVDRRAEVDEDGPLPADAPVVTQISRWDRLKDHGGVLECFARHVGHPDAHLVLVGPATAGVADDPEGQEVLEEVRAARRALPAGVRSRTHVAVLPMDDAEENGAMVNAIQRCAAVVVQKSLAEGFGLTVAEAMWKARPVVASAVGGIQEQIEDGESGILVEDAADLAGFGAAIDDLLADGARAERIGAAARERVLERFLGYSHLIRYLEVMDALVGERAAAANRASNP